MNNHLQPQERHFEDPQQRHTFLQTAMKELPAAAECCPGRWGVKPCLRATERDSRRQ